MAVFLLLFQEPAADNTWEDRDNLLAYFWEKCQAAFEKDCSRDKDTDKTVDKMELLHLQQDLLPLKARDMY
jgi:hypothetical protein